MRDTKYITQNNKGILRYTLLFLIGFLLSVTLISSASNNTTIKTNDSETTDYKTAEEYAADYYSKRGVKEQIQKDTNKTKSEKAEPIQITETTAWTISFFLFGIIAVGIAFWVCSTPPQGL